MNDGYDPRYSSTENLFEESQDARVLEELERPAHEAGTLRQIAIRLRLPFAELRKSLRRLANRRPGERPHEWN